MTYRELLKKEHPDRVGKKYAGGCRCCPYGYKYESFEDSEQACLKLKGDCEACWDREIPETEGTEKMKITYDEIPADYSRRGKKKRTGIRCN